MYSIRLFASATALTLCAVLALAGCSKPVQAPPEEKAPDAVAEDSTQVGPVVEKLPEVIAVNTAQIGGLLDKTVGKVTVVNLWATWCGPCVQEMPDLVKFYNEMDREAVAFVSVSLDTEADIKEGIPNFQRTHKVPFPIFVLSEVNPEGLTKALRGSFGGGIPTTFFYDRSGTLAKTVVGAIPMEELLSTVKSLVESKS